MFHLHFDHLYGGCLLLEVTSPWLCPCLRLQMLHSLYLDLLVLVRYRNLNKNLKQTVLQ